MKPAPGLLGVPCREWSWTGALWSIFELSHHLPPGSQVARTIGVTSIGLARNQLVRTLLSVPRLEWLLFVDSDQTPPPDTALRLLAHGDLDIVGGLYALRQHGFPLAMAPLDPSVTEIGPGLQEVRHAAGGCVLIRRRVFEAMPPGEWFKELVDEDCEFFDRARALGFRVWLDASLRVGHLAMVNLDPANSTRPREVA